jgi:hypothetical protein
MGKVLTVCSAGDLARFKPKESEFMKFRSVICPNVLHFAKDHVEYEEWLSKLTFCAEEFVYLEMKFKETPQDEHSFGEEQMRLGGYTPITLLRLMRRLADMGFQIKEKHYTGAWRTLVKAKRMERIPYTIDMDFMALREAVVVSDVPIDHEMWNDLWPLIEAREAEYHQRVRDLRRDYKVWMDEPIWFAKDKGHVVQGSHRLSLHKLMGKPTIDMRIMKTWWKDDPAIYKPEKIKERMDGVRARIQNT